MATHTTRERLYPFVLTLAVLAADQITKAIVAASIPYSPGRPGLGRVIAGGLVRIIHTRNPGIAFSIGHDLPDGIRIVLFTLLPVVVLGLLVAYYLRTDELTRLQRWAVAGILGGGLGNLVDRIFRRWGVVDFIDVEFFGIFGLERWPTFNLADATIVVCGLLLAGSLVFGPKRAEEAGD